MNHSTGPGSSPTSSTNLKAKTSIRGLVVGLVLIALGLAISRWAGWPSASTAASEERVVERASPEGHAAARLP